MPQLYLAVGTDVDKRFQTPGRESIDCNGEHLVSLKNAFYRRGHNAMAYPANAPSVYFDEYLKTVLTDITANHVESIPLDYSMVDIRCSKVLANNIDQDFLTYYYGQRGTSLRLTLGNDYYRWVYGLLHADENYNDFDQQTIDNQDFIYRQPTLQTERGFADKRSLVFIRSHYPFQDRKEAHDRFLAHPFNFATLPNVAEMCISIYTELRLRAVRSEAVEGRSANAIRKSLSDLISLLNEDTFHLASLDRKLHFIYDQWGINQERTAIETIGTLHAESISVKQNTIMNRWIIGLTTATVTIGLLQIFIPDMSNILLSSCNCGMPPTSCSGADFMTHLLLILMLICLVVIAVTLIVGNCQRGKTKSLIDEFLRNRRRLY